MFKLFKTVFKGALKESLTTDLLFGEMDYRETQLDQLFEEGKISQEAYDELLSPVWTSYQNLRSPHLPSSSLAAAIELDEQFEHFEKACQAFDATLQTFNQAHLALYGKTF